MTSPRTILITGGIGSGKSAVCSWLRARGIPVYDSDLATKEIYSRRPSVVSELENALGCSLRTSDGLLDRKLLAYLIFSDPHRLSLLEAIVHPIVLEDFKQWRSVQGRPFVAMESAIALSKPLFRGLFDAAVVVEASLETRIERVCERSGCSRDEAIARINAQNDTTGSVGEDLCVLPHLIIRNDYSLEDLHVRCEEVFGELMTQWK